MHRLLALTLLTVFPALLGCPPEGDCFSNADCAPGEVCNASNTCRPANIPEPMDASAYERWYPRPDGATASDAALEDALPEDGSEDGGEDGGPSDATLTDQALADTSVAVDSAQPDAGLQQVSSFSVCTGPATLALATDAQTLYVGCQTADSIKVYSSVSGLLDRDLSGLVSPCVPSSLLLREDKSQLWVSCSTSNSPRVYNVRPSNGANNQVAFTDSAAPSARFASAGNKVAWVTVNGNFYSMRNITSTAASAMTDGTVFGGNDVGMTASGDFTYLPQISSQTNAIRVLEVSGGSQPDIYSPVSSASWLKVASNGVLLVANNLTYGRMSHSGEQFPTNTAVDYGLIKTVITRADGASFFIGTFHAGDGNSRVYEISSDAAVSAPTLSSQDLSGCTLSALAAAADGRVFAACQNTNTVHVLEF